MAPSQPTITDFVGLKAEVLRQGGAVESHEREIKLLREDGQSLRLYLGSQFGQLAKQIEQLGDASDDDPTAVRMLKASIRRTEKQTAKRNQVILGLIVAVASPLVVDIIKRLAVLLSH